MEITDAALAHLARVLADEKKQHQIPDDADPPIFLRILFDDGIKLWRDAQQEGDETFEHDGDTVLLIDERLAEALTENKLDLRDGQLTLLAPGEA